MIYITEGILKWYGLKREQPFKITEDNLQLAENVTEEDSITLRFTEKYIQYYNEDIKQWLLYNINANDLFEIKIIERSEMTNKLIWEF